MQNIRARAELRVGKNLDLYSHIRIRRVIERVHVFTRRRAIDRAIQGRTYTQQCPRPGPYKRDTLRCLGYARIHS